MKNDKSVFTEAAEKAGDFLFGMNKEIAKFAPIPFGQRKVGSAEITRQVETCFTEQGGVDPVKLLPVVKQYGYDNVNEVMGKVLKKRGNVQI